MIDRDDSDDKLIKPEANGTSQPREFDLESGTNEPQGRQRSGLGLAELQAMRIAYEALEALDKEGQARALRWLTEALGFDDANAAVPARTSRTQAANVPASDHGGSQPNPREFISQKKPQSHVERVACLAYYLDRYRGLPHFKTPDIVSLNTEAASHKFGNPSRDVDNADRRNGYIVSAGNGAKQLTVRGEALVEALPDREAVNSALEEYPHKSKRSSRGGKRTVSSETDEQ